MWDNFQYVAVDKAIRPEANIARACINLQLYDKHTSNCTECLQSGPSINVIWVSLVRMVDFDFRTFANYARLESEEQDDGYTPSVFNDSIALLLYHVDSIMTQCCFHASS